MKKGITVLLALVMAVTLIPVCAFAQSGDTLTVQTRSSEYVFHVGDTFTYSYWLSLKPDVVNYSEDYLKELLGTSYGGDKELTGIGLADLTKLKLKSVSGNIKYDTECLSLVSAETPNIKLGLTKQKSDALGGTILDGTLFDFTNADLAFFSNIMTKAEKAQFNDPKVLVRCTFRVISGSDTPAYLRTKITHLEVTTQKVGNLVKEKDIKLVNGRTAFFPYESFETVDNEKPTIVLKSLVDDVGLDIRYLNISGDTSQYRRPGKGVTATMMGFSSDGRYVRLQKQTDGSEVMWLYDVPYGQYYVDCSFTDEQGRFFATPDPEKAEHINVPATGEIQALWLIETKPSETKQINVYVDWVGDEGYLPARPEYLQLQLYNEQDVTGLVLQQQIMQRTDSHTSFDNVNISDRSGEEIVYKLMLSAQGDSYAQYHYEVEQDGDDFYVTATYYGSPEDLWKIPVDQGGHYWVAVETTEPTCTLEGKTYCVCDVCHETKVVTIPALGHKVVKLPAVAASCTTAGKTEGSYCSVCGKVIRAQTIIPALGHTAVTDAGYPATCTENGLSNGTHCSVCGKVLTEQKIIPATGHNAVTDEGTPATCTENGLSDGSHCATCGIILQEQNLIPAKGHRYENGVCTECGAKDPNYRKSVSFTDIGNLNPTFRSAILWAAENDIACGYDDGSFRPNNTCTRAQVVTFLWRAAGSPEPTGDVSIFKDASDIASPFLKAVAWAVEKGITTGYNDGTFRPNDTVTRAQFVTFLYRFEGSPAVSGKASAFKDAAEIAGAYINAVAWAVEKGITTGYDDGTFRPNNPCTRAHVVTFLYRYLY